MKRRTNLNPDMASLPKEEREIVNGLSKVFVKHRYLGAIRLVELVRMAWEKEIEYIPRPSREKVHPKGKII